MNTARLKVFAQQARNILMEGVARKIEFWGFDKNGKVTDELSSVPGGYMLRERVYDDNAVPAKWQSLKRAIARKGLKEVVEEAAYTWFNRMMALRILAKNEYDPGQLEYAEGAQLVPMILQRARRGQYDFLNNSEKVRLLPLLTDYTRDTEAFGLLLTGYCHHHPLIRPVFGSIDDFTEILIPDNILSESGFLHLLNTSAAITDGDYRQVELIGWLYQFYISEKKDEIFAGFQKNKKAEAADIPAATQIFTPNWIVKYMVQNTVGKLWLDLKPDSPVKEQLKYLVENGGDRQSSAIISEAADIKLLDPACGSGHILVEGFDLLYQLFMEEFYTPQQAVETILSQCLYGLDIDKRAMQLSRFAVLLKAAKEYPDILRKPVMPHISAMPEPDNFSRQEVLDFLGEQTSHEEVLSEALKLMRDGQNLGSIMRFGLEEDTISVISQRFRELESANTLSFNEQVLFPRIRSYIEVLLVLTEKYEVVVANPPYMNSSNFNASLKHYTATQYPNSKSDLFAVFIEVSFERCVPSGYIAQITMQSWMFLSGFKRLRSFVLLNKTVDTAIDVGWNLFDNHSYPTAVISAVNTKNENSKSVFFNLTRTKTDRLKEGEFWRKENRFEIDQVNFLHIPNNPFAYWINESAVRVFDNSVSASDLYKIREGVKTGDNGSFIKFWFEVLPATISINGGSVYFPHTKGGGFRKWFGNNIDVLLYENEGEALKKFKGASVADSADFFKSYTTWSRITYNQTSFRFVDEGFIPNMAGLAAIPIKPTHNKYLLAFGNSTVGQYFLSLLNPTLNFPPGIISILPMAETDMLEKIETRADFCISIAEKDWDLQEISWNFARSALLNGAPSAEKAYDYWYAKAVVDFFQLHLNEEELNQIFIEIYGLHNELTPEVTLKDITILQEELDRGQLAADDVVLREVGLGIQRKDKGFSLLPDGYSLPVKREVVIKQLISYAIGCFVGRYRLDKPGLNVAHPNPSDEELAAYVVQANDGKSSYQFKIEEDAILPMMGKACNFTNDVLLRMQQFVEMIWGPETYTGNMNFLEECLDMDLEKYLVNKFWGDHKKTYKKKPIYWLFTSDKGAFQVLVYMHRMNRFTVEKIRSEYLLPHMKYLQMQMDLLSDSGQEPKRFEKLRKDLLECEAYDLVLKDKADQQIEFDLDDGVTENYKRFKGVVGAI